MLNITRRELCKAAGVGAAALAISPLAACAGNGGEVAAPEAQESQAVPEEAPAQSENYPNGTPSTLFGAPGKHAWFYDRAPRKGATPSLLAFEDGTVTFYPSYFFNLLPNEEKFSINDLIDLTDEEIIAKYADSFRRAYESLEPGADTDNIMVPAFAGGGSHPYLGDMEGGKVVDRPPLEFPATPLDLHIETDNTGNTTVSEDFTYEDTSISLFTSPFYDDPTEAPDLEVLQTFDIDIDIAHKEHEITITGAVPKPFEVYTAYYSAFTTKSDDNYIYTQIRGNGNSISLDQPGAEGVSVD